jgi:outer membrane immunogenic protein
MVRRDSKGGRDSYAGEISTMRRYVAAAIALTIASAAYADDLPNPGYGGPPAAPSSPSWTGLYVGGSAGYTTEKDQFVGPTTGSSQQPSGGLVGGQMGYNQQSGPFVLGIEGSANSSVSRFGR